jgi:catechol 2,3-dioxygenase-like lactoylglutathione lyase family enzyme
MITGAHTMINSTDPDADRAFLRDVFGLPSVDAGEGWLIFGMPLSEIAVHPAEKNGAHELYLLCEDIDAFTATMKDREVPCTPVSDEPWGRLTAVTLPGGGALGVYQPLHPRPASG